MPICVTVKLQGGLGVLAGRRRVRLEVAAGATVDDVVKALVAALPPAFAAAVVDPVLGEPGLTALVLVNGREISVLDGVRTVMGDGDEVVVVPVTHTG